MKPRYTVIDKETNRFLKNPKTDGQIFPDFESAKKYKDFLDRAGVSTFEIARVKIP